MPLEVFTFSPSNHFRKDSIQKYIETDGQEAKERKGKQRKGKERKGKEKKGKQKETKKFPCVIEFKCSL
jgi:hypothetical protein